MMMVVSTTGYIIECYGPYLADGNNNDAKITRNIMDDKERLNNFFKEDDVFVVDRGLRDIIDYLSKLGINIEILAYFEKNLKQHSVQEANESRFVTKIRWVVEAINDVIKTWKHFDNIVLNTNIPKI